MEEHKTKLLGLSIIYGGDGYDKIYVEKNGLTIVYDLLSEQFDTVSFKIGKIFFLTPDSLWMINQFADSFELTNTTTNKKKSFDFYSMFYLANSMFECRKVRDADTVHLVNPNNNEIIASRKKQGYVP